MVVVVDRPEIDRDEVAGLDEFLAGDAVGLRRVGAADHDGVERDAVGAELAHEVLELIGEVPLRHAGFQDVEEFFERFFGDVLRSLHLFDFRLTLDLPKFVRQRVEPVRNVEGVSREHLAPLVQFGQGHAFGLDEDLRAAVLLEKVEDLLIDLVLQDDLRLRDGIGCSLKVPAVRDERALLRHDQKGAVRGREPGEIEAVLLAQNERRLCRFQLRSELCDVHDMVCSFRCSAVSMVIPSVSRPIARACV